ncbi:hypothetical protein [Mucilaginibacter sp.]|uniref:hypothetical protein n=1 Tax=Mucilaginibacter sp. TaxID=1882438 RepID=UPI0026172E17|nr:hypothetical protein [Mucilaginibacter sp.]
MPLVKLVVPNPSIKSKFAVLQNPITGEIELIHDFRAESSNKGLITVIDFTDYNPHHNQSPYAAYLVPKNLKAGEDVWLDDLIENIVGAQWNQGDCFRLPSCKATWDGNDFILQVPKDGPAIMVG